MAAGSGALWLLLSGCDARGRDTNATAPAIAAASADDAAQPGRPYGKGPFGDGSYG